MMKEQARPIVSARGWLARQPESFQDEVLRRAGLLRVEPGEPVYRIGDPPGGVYGVVSGLLGVSIGPPGGGGQHLVHFYRPGDWIGEGGFFMGDQRRVELRTATDCQLLHLTLDAMDQMAAQDPLAARRFGGIIMLNVELAMRVIDDLLILRVDRRVAAVLTRLAAGEDRPLPVSQHDLGLMASATRKQVNAALAGWAGRGWVAPGYRAIRVIDPAALRAFARADA